MYERFLTNSDYYGVIYEHKFLELIEGSEDSVCRAEEAAEAAIVEYLSEKYEIEKVLAFGKSIKPYSNRITYPANAFFWYDGKVQKTLRTITGLKAPTNKVYWEELIDDYGEEEEEFPENPDEGGGEDEGDGGETLPEYPEEILVSNEFFGVDRKRRRKHKKIKRYRQTQNYSPNDVVKFAHTKYICREYNGIDFGEIRIPGLNGWEKIEVYNWEANLPYNEWEAVKDGDNYYALINNEDVDLTVRPMLSDNWGLIGKYDPEYNKYEFSPTEYVEFNGELYIPTMEVNHDVVKEGYNIKAEDPRSSSIRKQMVRLATYELFKLISPCDVSNVRITDYEAALQWLRDASKLRINPQIPRKIGADRKPVTDWHLATFQRDYDPNQNVWQI